MKRLNKTLLFGLGAVAIAALFGIAQTAFGAAGEAPDKAGWHTNLDEAKAAAAESGKILMLEFHGSDWCPPCIKLQNDILATESFKAFAEANLVLVNLDFPRRTPLPEAQRAYNTELAQQYGVQGFPTVVLLSASGEELDRIVGFPRGGYNGFMEFLKQHTKS